MELLLLSLPLQESAYKAIQNNHSISSQAIQISDFYIVTEHHDILIILGYGLILHTYFTIPYL